MLYYSYILCRIPVDSIVDELHAVQKRIIPCDAHFIILLYNKYFFYYFNLAPL